MEPRAVGESTAALARGIQQVREHVSHLLSQVYRVRFGDASLEFERKHPGNEGGVTLTPSDDGLSLGGVTRRDGGFTLGGVAPRDDWCTFTGSVAIFM
jgi:hypothetical protein